MGSGKEALVFFHWVGSICRRCLSAAFLSAGGLKNVIRASRSLRLPFHYIVSMRKE